MTHDESHVEYVRVDGKVRRIQRNASAPIEEHDLLNEYRGLVLRKRELVKNLAETDARLAALKPIVTAIMDEHATPAKGDGAEHHDPEEVGRVRNRIMAHPEKGNGLNPQN